MTIKEDIQTNIAKLQAELALLNSVAEDTFSFGTVVVFSSGSTKWHYVKVAEEAWKPMGSSSVPERSLAEWVLNAVQANIGYFEVYVLTVAATPFFASS